MAQYLYDLSFFSTVCHDWLLVLLGLVDLITSIVWEPSCTYHQTSTHFIHWVAVSLCNLKHAIAHCIAPAVLEPGVVPVTAGPGLEPNAVMLQSCHTAEPAGLLLHWLLPVPAVIERLLGC